jgi:hypothetical protein
MAQSPPTDLILCRCTAFTIEAFLVRNSEREPVSCWIALDGETGLSRRGCGPSEWTDDVVTRRNSRLKLGPRRTTSDRPVYPTDLLMRCACGRLTRVLTSSANDKPLVPVQNAADALKPYGPQDCWLGIADDGGPIAGCAPDYRTWEILARARRQAKPKRSADLVAEPIPTTVSAQAREDFERVLHPNVTLPPDEKAKHARTKQANASNSKPVKSTNSTTIPKAPFQELSLFG